MEHILEHRAKITEQLVKSYNGEESTTGAPKFIVIGHSLAGSTALTAILNALEKSQSTESLNIFVDNNIDETKHQVPSAIDSIVLKGFSVEQLLIIKEDTGSKLEKSYIPELINLIKAEDSVIEEKYKKKIAALKERRDPEGIEKSDEEKKETKEFQKLEDEGTVSDEDEDNVEKGGEGSRGGKVIGHTKSGKPIYMNQNAMAEKHYTSKDHEDAAYKHLDHNKETGKDSDHHATQFDRHMDSSRHKKAQEDVEKEVAGLKKSEELTPGEIERQRVANNLQKAYTPIFEDPDYLEKGKKAEIGEIRTWGGVKYVKHQDGWVTFNQKTGKGSVYGSDGKKKMDATLNHIGHYSEHTDTKGGGHVVLPDGTVKINKPKDPLLDMGYSQSDIEDFLNEYSQGGSKLPEKVREVLDKRFLNQNKTEKVTKPTLEEVDSAFSAAGKALAEGRDPDAITTLRDQAKKLGAAYGMSNEKIDEAISTSKKAHQGEHNQSTDAEKAEKK